MSAQKKHLILVISLWKGTSKNYFYTKNKLIYSPINFTYLPKNKVIIKTKNEIKNAVKR